MGMANFSGPPRHYWDVYNGANVRKRLSDQMARESEYGTKHGVIYFSDYMETAKWLQNSSELSKALYRHTSSLHRTLKRNIGRDEGTDGRHMADVPKIRRVRKGGVHQDRIAYHIYVVNATPDPKNAGNQFLHAEYRSKFSKDAWKWRMGIGGEAPNKTVQPNRKGWIDRSLSQASRVRGRPKS
ncbi:MAG: hypothetical protein PHW63_10620 [Alphaproteobacteria bacterium]|nr:hypothetical protein [Alphaproteobacteria bacterium]